MTVTLEPLPTLSEGPTDDDVCHMDDCVIGGTGRTLCGREAPDEPQCCGHAPPCGRPPCPDCYAVWASLVFSGL